MYKLMLKSKNRANIFSTVFILYSTGLLGEWRELRTTLLSRNKLVNSGQIRVSK